MKYRILHNTPLEFFNTSADLVGSITANGTNLKISSVSGVIELGNTATDIQVGTIGTSVNWSFMGGGTIGAAGGGTISLGQSGDTVNMNVAGVTYNWPAKLLQYNQITGVNNKIDISTSVPGSVILTLPNRPVVGQLSLTDNIAATSNTTGTLQVAGGASISGNLYVSGTNSSFTGNLGVGTTTPTWKVDTNLGSISSGSISTGGYSVTGDATSSVGYVTYNMQLNNSTSNASGYMRLARTSSTAYLGMQIGSQSRDGISFLTGTTTPSEQVRISATGVVTVLANTIANSTTTGALIVTGGVGVSGNLYAGNVVSLGIATATRFISTATTGAPFTVLSNTSVANLNADLLDGLEGTSYANTTFAQAGFDKANAATTSAQNAYNLSNTSSQLAYSNISVNGVLISADTKQTTLTLTSGNGVTLLANSVADSINVQLTSTGVTAGTYGSSNTIPVITVDAQGRISFANAVSSSSGSSGSLGYPNSSVSTIYGALSSKDLRTGPDNVTAETPFELAVDAFGVLVTTVYDCMDPVGSYTTFDLNT